MITLYHGSFAVVNLPQVSKGRNNLDFGQGFYLTAIREQAEKWARLITERKSRSSIPQLNIYHFDDEMAKQYKWLKFESYNYDWLEFVVSCRAGEGLWKQYDIIEGGVANDNVIDTVEDYAMGIITAEQALGQLRYKSVNHQLCITNQNVIEQCLHIAESITLSPEVL